MKEKRNYIIPVFIPELACPFQCIFCDQKKISGSITVPDLSEISEIIKKHLSTIPAKDSRTELAFFGGNFTGIPEDEQQKYLESVQHYIQNGLIESIRISTRPDYITSESLEMLKSFSVKTIELGAQSLDDEVLKLSGRGHKVEDVVDASKLIKENGFDLGLQMMIGLPGDTKEKAIETANRIVELGASCTRIYPTLVIRGTKLDDLYRNGKYSPLALEEAVNWTKDILPIFEENDVTVLRIGLHPSEGLINGHELVAGPFHQSFRELVLTEIWHDKFNGLTVNSSDKNILITVNNMEINYAIGHSSMNRKELQRYFREVKFTASDRIKKGEFDVNFY